MSFNGDMSDDESSMQNLLHFFDFSDSTEPCFPLMQQQDQHQAHPHQQQQGNSHESCLRGALLNEHSSEQQSFFSRPMLNPLQESSAFTMNQRQIGQQFEQGNNGFAHPTMANAHEFPNHRQEQVLPVPFMIQQERSAPMGSLFPQQVRRFSNNYNLPVIIATNMTPTPQNLAHLQQQRQHLYAHTRSTREPRLNNQYHNYYDLDQIMAMTSEHSGPIGPPGNFVLNRSQNHMPYQTHAPFTLSFNINGEQALTYWVNEPHNPRMVNNSAGIYLQHSFMPRLQMSSRVLRSSMHHGGMQRLVRQSSSSFRFSNFNTHMRIRPSPYSIIPPQSGVLGSRRRSYENRFQFEESSSSTRRRRIILADGNVGSTAINPAEEWEPFGIYDPIYESLGLFIDPHLRSFVRWRDGR